MSQHLREPSCRIRIVIISLAIYIMLPTVARAQWTLNGDDIYNSNSGNVGIGTTPAEKLDINGTVRLRGWDAVVHSYDTSGRYQDLIGTYEGWYPGAVYIAGYNAVNNPNLNSTTRVSIGGYGSERLWVDLATGRVGIGTTSPSATLDVAGSVTVSGNISAKYQDLAEWVPSTQPIAAGSVVILDQNTDNGVLPSTQPYDTRVAGVVSDSPGIVLGEGGPGKLKVATTGRVKVRVDATCAPIQRGDLLVTSDKPGFAMKSEPLEIAGRKFHQPGTLIGKALEPLGEGEGEILVLLSLQ